MFDMFQAIPLAFYSSPFYRQLLQRGRGIGMTFVFLLVLINLIYVVVTTFAGMQQIMAKLPELAARMPVATFKDHKLTIDQPSPYIVKIGDDTTEKNAELPTGIMIDTGYAITDVNALMAKMKAEKVFMFFTGQQMVTLQGRQDDVKIQTYGFVPDTVITHDDWMRYGKTGTIALPLVMLLAVGFALFIAMLFKIMFGGLIALLIGAFIKSVPDYGAAMRLAGAAALPPALLFLVTPHYGWVRFLIWIGYMVFGARSASLPENR